MNIARWESFREFEDMFRQHSPFFTRAMRRFEDEESTWRPVADISETDTEYLIKAELLPTKPEQPIAMEVKSLVLSAGGFSACRS